MALWFLPMIANAVGSTNKNGGSNSAGAVMSALGNISKAAKKTPNEQGQAQGQGGLQGAQV